MASIADIAARIHADMCTDERNGYSWNPRWGGDHPDGKKTLTIDGRKYTYKLGSYDCSSSVITAWKLALQYTKYAGKLDNATYTGDMRSVFLKSGLFYADRTSAKRGDVYLNDNKHTAMCQDGGSDGVYNKDMLSQFSINENGGVYGGKVGDQTGRESRIQAFYEYPWSTTLHYNGKADGAVTSTSPAKAASALDVDGDGGTLTVSEWQRQMGTTVDGEISGQPASLAEWWPAMVAIAKGNGGSELVKAVQRKVGLTGDDVDGEWGRKTTMYVQLFLLKNGYDIGPFDSDCVKALQRSLNDGKWK